MILSPDAGAPHVGNRITAFEEIMVPGGMLRDPEIVLLVARGGQS